jgi:hypothetical protein
MSSPTSPAYTEATLTPAQVNLASVPLSLLILVACALPYLLLWGPASLGAGFSQIGLWFIPVFILGVVVHELLHGLGWLWWGKLAPADIKFGFHWKVLMPYAHARTPMGVRAYRWGAALPGIVTGGLPALAGLVLGQPVLLIMGTIFVLAAVGDLMILWAIRKLPITARVLDHPTLPGCLVLRENVG